MIDPSPMNAREAGLVASVIEAIEELRKTASAATGANEVVALGALHKADAEMYRLQERMERAIAALETERDEDEEQPCDS